MDAGRDLRLGDLERGGAGEILNEGEEARHLEWRKAGGRCGDHRLQHLRTGRDTFLQKPFDLVRITEEIEKLLNVSSGRR